MVRKPPIFAAKHTADELARQNQKAEEYLKARPELWEDISVYRESSKTLGCSSINLWELYRTLRWLQPTHVLECGSGVSTVAIAHALMQNEFVDGKPGIVVSMEDQPKWHEEHKERCPEDLRSYVEYHLSPKKPCGLYCFRGVAYEQIPPNPYSFVFIDGPFFGEGIDMTCNLDFFDVVAESKVPVWGQIDGRLSTVFVMQSLLPKGMVRFDPTLCVTQLGPVTSEDLPSLCAPGLFYDNCNLRPEVGRFVQVALR